MFKQMIEAKRRKAAKEAKVAAVKRTAVGLGIGSIIGAVTGILFAPKEGKETRKQIVDKSKEISEKVKTNVDEGVEVAKKKFGDLKKCCKKEETLVEDNVEDNSEVLKEDEKPKNNKK